LTRDFFKTFVSSVLDEIQDRRELNLEHLSYTRCELRGLNFD